MNDLILTGFMGTGKTAVGKLLAHRFGLEFVDTDAEVECRAGCSIAELWAEQGEPAFRELEATFFRDLMGTFGGRVIATGAGTLVSEHNLNVVPATARVICLACRLDVLVARLLPGRQERPLLAGLDEAEMASSIEERLERRRVVYEQFEQLDTSDLSLDEVAAELAIKAGIAHAARIAFNERTDSRILFGRGLLASLGEILRGTRSRSLALQGVSAGIPSIPPSTDLPASMAPALESISGEEPGRPKGLDYGFEAGTVLLVSDNEIWECGWPQLAIASLEAAGLTVHVARIPAGEEHKTLDTVSSIYNICLEAHLDRSATVLGIGGGVVGDVAGLVAATYLRGLRLCLAPTTLLAQVDASVGGKVGVDFQGVKNLVGAFHPAETVIIDPDVSGTLPASALSAGLAEVVKIAWVRNASLLDSVEKLASATEILDHPSIIRRAAEEKARLVDIDPYEHGDRALLNFGHTIGHGLEGASGYRLGHGQAVSVGMAAEMWLAERDGWCAAGSLDRLLATLRRLDLPVVAPDLDARKVLELVGQDKKRRSGRIRLAVPTKPGQGALIGVTDTDIRDAIEYAVGGSG